MKKNTFLRLYSFVYLVLGLLGVFAIISIYVFPDATKDIVNDLFKNYDIKSMDPKTAFAISIGISSALYLIYSWLVRRVANGQSRGTLLLILLVFSIAGEIVNLIHGFSIVTCILLAIDLYAFFAVIRARN